MPEESRQLAMGRLRPSGQHRQFRPVTGPLPNHHHPRHPVSPPNLKMALLTRWIKSAPT